MSRGSNIRFSGLIYIGSDQLWPLSKFGENEGNLGKSNSCF